MLTCIPQSLCNWNYRVLGASAGPATLHFDFFTEQGDLSLGAMWLAVHKHGPFSGFWTLEQGGQVIAEAHKPNVLLRSFNVRNAEVAVTLAATSPFMRGYDIHRGNRLAGTIRPAHPFTRRAFIECSPDIPEVLQLFCFWLAVITWRRTDRAAAG